MNSTTTSSKKHEDGKVKLKLKEARERDIVEDR